MRFDQIVIKNYRQYQQLDFVFPHGAHDLHIIVAQNRVGKTNLLNALTWCFYGKEPHLGNSDPTKGKPIINATTVEEARKNGISEEEVVVTTYASDGQTKLIYERCLPVKIGRDTLFREKEIFSVRVSLGQDYKTYEGEAAKPFVECYMPESIRKYFYFDGEQLNNYFLSATPEVRAAIYAISQVDLVSKINNRLGDVIKQYGKEAAKNQPDIQVFSSATEEAGKAIEAAQKDITELKEQITKSTAAIEQISSELRDQENLPELEVKYQDSQNHKSTLDQKRADIIERMLSFIRQQRIALTFCVVAQKAIEVIDQKRAEKALPPNIDKEMLIGILHDHRCTICNHDLSSKEEAHIKELIDKFQVSSATSNILTGMYDELKRLVAEARSYPSDKAKLADELSSIDAEIKKNDKTVVDLLVRIGKFDDKGHVRQMYEDRNHHKMLIETNTKKLGVAESRLSLSQESQLKANNALSKALGQIDECKYIKELIDFAADCQRIMRETESEIMADIRVQMEDQTTTRFLQLIWKKNAFKKIILSDDYRLDLISTDDYSCVGTCSATERSLLALSFTLALHEVSGFKSLLFIDTPIARASDVNRTNFAEVLKVVSENKQIILTFAPSEYSSEIKQVFAPVAASSVSITLENEQNVRKVVD